MMRSLNLVESTAWKVLPLLVALPIIFTWTIDIRAQEQNVQQDEQQVGEGQKYSEQIQGEIIYSRTIEIFDTGDKEVVAKVKTKDGRVARVLLGPQEKLSEINISEGSQVDIAGSRGTINEKAMLIAQKISAGNQTVQIDRQSDENLKKFGAEVLQTRTTEPKGEAPPYVLARLRLDTGNVAVVNLGPEVNLREIELVEGERFTLLARPVRIEGKTALVVQELRAGDETVKVDWFKIRKQIEKQKQEKKQGRKKNHEIHPA